MSGVAVAETSHSGVELPTNNDYSEVEEGGRGGGRQGRATMPSTVHPEILVLADSAFYKSMGRSSVAVQRYLTSYFNAVNMRFATVSKRFAKEKNKINKCKRPYSLQSRHSQCIERG